MLNSILSTKYIPCVCSPFSKIEIHRDRAQASISRTSTGRLTQSLSDCCCSCCCWRDCHVWKTEERGETIVRQKLRNSLLFAYSERFPAHNYFRVCFWLIVADSLIFSVAFAEPHPLLWDNRDTRSGWTDALTAFMYVREPSCFIIMT